MAVVVKLVNTLDCGSSIREFESRQSPHFKKYPHYQMGFLFYIKNNWSF